LGDPVYESKARRAVKALWSRRDNQTGLLGNVIHVASMEWTAPKFSGLGAGMDSFYEYLLKTAVAFDGQEGREDLHMFHHW